MYPWLWERGRVILHVSAWKTGGTRSASIQIEEPWIGHFENNDFFPKQKVVRYGNQCKKSWFSSKGCSNMIIDHLFRYKGDSQGWSPHIPTCRCIIELANALTCQFGQKCGSMLRFKITLLRLIIALSLFWIFNTLLFKGIPKCYENCGRTEWAKEHQQISKFSLAY